MHHKRKRPKNQRAGCLMCKFWKVNGYPKEGKQSESWSSHRRRKLARGEIEDAKREQDD